MISSDSCHKYLIYWFNNNKNNNNNNNNNYDNLCGAVTRPYRYMGKP